MRKRQKKLYREGFNRGVRVSKKYREGLEGTINMYEDREKRYIIESEFQEKRYMELLRNVSQREVFSPTPRIVIDVSEFPSELK
jgi:seryl-tRNA(Sec) selenium transferase